jgi:alpha-L-fucosidase
LPKRTQRRAEQRRANRENGEQTRAVALAQQAPTGSTETKSTTSQAQIAANRENATHSTGPTSDIGKAIVS